MPPTGPQWARLPTMKVIVTTNLTNKFRSRFELEFLSERVVPSASHLYAVGQDIGGASLVRVYNEDGSPNRDLSPYPGFSGGARVATGDVNGDGIDDIAVAPGPGGGPEL